MSKKILGKLKKLLNDFCKENDLEKVQIYAMLTHEIDKLEKADPSLKYAREGAKKMAADLGLSDDKIFEEESPTFTKNMKKLKEKDIRKLSNLLEEKVNKKAKKKTKKKTKKKKIILI